MIILYIIFLRTQFILNFVHSVYCSKYQLSVFNNNKNNYRRDIKH